MAEVCYEVAQWKFSLSYDEQREDVPKLLPQYRDFRITPQPSDFFLTVVPENELDSFSGDEVGQFDCGGANHGVWRDAAGRYAFAISTPDRSLCCRLHASPDFKRAQVAPIGDMVHRAFGLNNALMIVFAFFTAPYSTLLLHASTVVKAEKAYCFLGASGTGKSTHSRLWMDVLQDVVLLNDDNPVLRVNGNEVLIYGSPWSGKTPCYKQCSYPLGSVVRLAQAPFNRIHPERKIPAFASLLSACSTMVWDKRSYDGACATVAAVVSLSPFYRLECLPDHEAALLCSKTVAS